MLLTAVCRPALLDLRDEATYNRDNVAGKRLVRESWHHQRLAGF
ncbi:hypothetical protein BN1184_BY_01590 [Pantoea ananatis]|nr:hypothetical protein BN1184_BY_01590 [Pantoea ananatis]